MKKVAFLFLFGSVFLAGCPEHEVIPAPVPKVELEAHFAGTVNGTQTEWTQDVQGFFLEATKTKVINPSPTPSTAVYTADFKTAEGLTSLKLRLGQISWDASVAGDPTLDQFNSFFLSNQAPVFAAGAAGGFEVVYRDGFGNIWTSDPAAPINDVTFSNIVQESDASGDYSKFTCEFDCTLKRTVGPDTYYLDITNAVYTGWFKR